MQPFYAPAVFEWEAFDTTHRWMQIHSIMLRHHPTCTLLQLQP